MLYHIVPQNMTGNVLYPLNELQNVFPDVYAVHAKKYEGYEYLTRMAVPILDCRWNDVLHLSLVHPADMREAMIAAGFDVPSRYYFEIDPAENGFNEQNAVLYLYPDSFELREDSFMPYSPEALTEIAGQLSDWTTAQHQLTDHRSLMFYRVPIVFYKGTLETDHLNVIEV
jgi:hypothetical protein